MEKIALFFIFVFIGPVVFAEELDFGVRIEYGYVPGSSDELGRGDYNYSGVYIGSSVRRLDIGIMHDSDDCNVKHQRISYSQHFNIERWPIFWGVELINLDRKFDSNCFYPGAFIPLPLPYFSYRHSLFLKSIKLNAEIALYINRVGASVAVGF